MRGFQSTTSRPYSFNSFDGTYATPQDHPKLLESSSVLTADMYTDLVGYVSPVLLVRLIFCIDPVL